MKKEIEYEKAALDLKLKPKVENLAFLESERDRFLNMSHTLTNLKQDNLS